jgi:hypothetical protein
MAGPDLSGPREPFTVAHLERWPMGAGRTELLDGRLYRPGDFDERDAMVARRALNGSRISVEPGVGLSAGPMLEDEPTSREWRRWVRTTGFSLVSVVPLARSQRVFRERPAETSTSGYVEVRVCSRWWSLT